MAIASRTARTTWKRSLAAGLGTLTSDSGALDGQEDTRAARTESPGGKTGPEELCVSSSAVLFEVDGGSTIVSSQIKAGARVPDLSQADFAAVIEKASGLCPVSRLFAGAAITVEAELLAG